MAYKRSYRLLAYIIIFFRWLGICGRLAYSATLFFAKENVFARAEKIVDRLPKTPRNSSLRARNYRTHNSINSLKYTYLYVHICLCCINIRGYSFSHRFKVSMEHSYFDIPNCERVHACCWLCSNSTKRRATRTSFSVEYIVLSESNYGKILINFTCMMTL